jgi:hypothetical protein
MDHQQQIERWNKYQEILDEISKKCNEGLMLGLLEVSIPRAWLAQQRTLKFMERLSDVQLEMAEERKQQQS